MNRVSWYINVIGLLLLLIVATVASSQERSPSEPVEVPPGVLPLPEPGTGIISGTLISADNATFYKEILAPEIYRLIRFHKTTIDAARRVKYDFKFDDNWMKGTAELSNFDKKLSEDGGIDFSFPRIRGFIFGDSAAINNEWQIARVGQDKKEVKAEKISGDKEGIGKDENLLTLGKKILWNTNSAIWSQGLLEYHFRLLWLQSGKAWRNVRGNYLRVYPWLLDPNFKLPQLFREKFSFYYPEPLHGLSWLTFRFQNLDEDLVWAYSPAINKLRQMTASNRTDSLITSSFSAEDFFGWSGNPALYNITQLGKITTLIPFPSAELARLDSSLQPCYRLINPTGGDDQAIWNFETPKFPGAADWLPIKAVFVPREVYKVELSTKDPYSLYGREVLYIDSELMLPFYKVVYDRAGRHWKTIISSFGLAGTDDRKRRSVYPGFTVVLDMLAGKEFVLDYSRIRYCDSYPQDIELGQFDPKKLIP